MDRWMDGWTDGRTENLSILQDFVPYRGRCPAAAQLQPKNCVKRDKGTADHIMPLGDWLEAVFCELCRWDEMIYVADLSAHIFLPFHLLHAC